MGKSSVVMILLMALAGVWAGNELTLKPQKLDVSIVEPVGVYPYLRAKEPTVKRNAGQFPKTATVDEDSIHTVLVPGDAVYIRVDTRAGDVEAIDLRDSLPEECINAINISPRWLKLDLYQSFLHLPEDRAQELADVILGAPDEEIDEIAFCVAHMSPQSLTDDRFDPELLRINADWIYRLADSLQYVELREYGSGDDWYTTTAYPVVSGDLTDTSVLEIPRDIYYWFVVHPKLSDEAPKMRDDSHDTRELTFGYFWREFLWANPDDHWDYTNGGEYPLLSDWMKIPSVLWIRDDTVLAADREVNENCGALDVLGHWVSTMLPSPPGALRPIQPNQIAVAHYGNCGEVQDLLAAAGRTALLPINCVGTMLQDHVWNEFWDDGYPGPLWEDDPWHCYQVDRWGGVTSLEPSWGGYDSDRGGSKNINDALTWRGDGYMIDRTPAYTNVCTLVVEVLDVDGNPVPGAQVTFASNSYYDTAGLYLADIRVTGSDGRVVVSMGDNCPYYYRVDSPVGDYPSGTSVTAFPTLGTDYAVAGETYIASVDLYGSLGNLPITELSDPSGPNQITVSFSAPAGYIRGPAVFDGQGGTYSYKTDGALMTVFVCDSANFELYRSGRFFEAYEYHSRQPEGEFTLNLPDGVWYVIASAEELIANDYEVYLDVQLNSTGIAENKLPTQKSLHIAPNPFNSSCRIDVGTGFSAGRIDIYDFSGKVVYSRKVIPGEQIVWNPDLPSGVYNVKLSTDSFAINRKVVLLK